MSHRLYRWGRFAATHARRVLVVWLVLVAAVVAGLATQPKAVSSSLTLAGTPAQNEMDAIAARLPQAGGTQGSVSVTAADGGRIDTPERAEAISRALDDAVATGYVVDRAAARTRQRSQLEQQVRATVADQFADRLDGTLSQLVDALTPVRSMLEQRGAAAPADQRARLQELSASTGRIIDTATDLRSAEPEQRISGASALYAQVGALRAQLEAAGLGDRMQLPDAMRQTEDPQQAFDRAVQQATSTAEQNMETLSDGTGPTGSPLQTSAGPLPQVLVSEDGTTAIVSLQLTGRISDLPDGTLDTLMAAIDRPLDAAGMSGRASSSLQPLEPPLGGHEAIGLVIAVVVLLFALGSPVLAGLPVLTALTGALLGVGGAYALSSRFRMSTATPAIGLMLGLAVGIDYSLFIVHKQRSLLRHEGLSGIEATARAVATAGGAVLFAGGTVIVALLGMLILGIGFVTTMALVAAVTVALAVALALSALPALLGLLTGRRPAREEGAPGDGDPGPGHDSRFTRAARWWVRTATARPVLTIVLVVVALGALAAPARTMELGMPSGAVAEAGSPSRLNYDAVSRTLGEGANTPLVVTLTPQDAEQVDQNRLLGWQRDLAAEEHVASVRLMGATDDRDLVVFAVTPDAGPNAPSTSDLVTSLRDTPVPDASAVGVTGQTAMNIDLSAALAAAVPVYLVVIVGLSLIILLVVFRSLVMPVTATLGFLLTIGAALGLAVAAFSTDGLTRLSGVDRAGPILSFLPIVATGILYGLAMDYQVFLGSSMSEEHVHGAGAREAVARGFHRASRVVASAAVIMVSVFAGFALSTDTTIRQFGFALSAGVLIDAFVVRMTLMPAVLSLAGEAAWWLPRWLARLLPEVDVEGARLGTGDDAGTTDRAERASGSNP